MRVFIAPSRLFPGSSAVEQPAVNRLVAGSNPARGAKLKQRLKVKTVSQKQAKMMIWQQFWQQTAKLAGRPTDGR